MTEDGCAEKNAGSAGAFTEPVQRETRRGTSVLVAVEDEPPFDFPTKQKIPGKSYEKEVGLNG